MFSVPFTVSSLSGVQLPWIVVQYFASSIAFSDCILAYLMAFLLYSLDPSVYSPVYLIFISLFLHVIKS